MSQLEMQLKRIVQDHPEAVVHAHSPSGPYVRAVLWEADGHLLGQAFWEPDGQRWVVRCFDQKVGPDSLVVQNPASMRAISGAITEVIARVRAAA